LEIIIGGFLDKRGKSIDLKIFKNYEKIIKYLDILIDAYICYFEGSLHI